MIIFLFIECSFFEQRIFQKISLNIEAKTVAKGQKKIIKSDVYYLSNGKMISYYQEPDGLILSNNRKGEITLYNKTNNTVTTQQNFLYGTETNQLYYFLENKKSDLGLINLGYSISETRFENALKITHWNAPEKLKASISKVELVHEKSNPIYMAYYGKNKNFLKKVYFYKYEKIGEYITLPLHTIQIDFISPSDSVITKTTYSNIKINQEVDDSKFDFSIPKDAIVVK